MITTQWNIGGVLFINKYETVLLCWKVAKNGKNRIKLSQIDVTRVLGYHLEYQGCAPH